MCVWERHLLASLLTLALLLLPARAWGWVETSTKAHSVVLDVERDGSAVVSHEIIIKVKGGPLAGFDLNGVDADAAPLPDATVSSADPGPSGATAIPLLLERRDDGSLRVEIDHPKGVSRGTFVFKLRYRTHLGGERNLVRQVGSMVEVRWVGPRPQDGIDSARVVFRLPPGSPAPRLADADPEQGDGPGATFLANLRRAADKDELELVRPHVAKGEPVVWRVTASPKSFDGFAGPEQPPLALPTLAVAERPDRRLAAILALIAVALGYASLLLVKWRALCKACKIRSAAPRALIPIPAVLRAALSGALLGAAVTVALEAQEPSWAGALLVGTIALAAHVAPRPIPAPRSPGRWLALSDEDAFEVKEAGLPGRWLDAGSLPGFLVFLGALGVVATAAVLVFARSPYYGLSLALGASVLLPVFCTGRTGELPPDPARRPAPLLRWLASRLRQDTSLKVVAWARLPELGVDPDELRLLILPRRPLPGLGGIELGMEYQSGLGGPVELPWVMARVTDGSEAQQALPHGIEWARGRKPEERVALLRPKLPTRALCLSLLRTVAAALTDRASATRRPRQPAIKLPMSAGRGSSTAKGSRTTSPAQAT